MKKISTYFSLLMALFLVALPSKAGGITSLEELSNTAAYVIKSARGYMVYAPQYAKDRAWCSQNNTNGAQPIEVNEAEANNQWAIITSPKGFSYLWNVGAKQFLYKKDPATVFSATPQGNDFNILASTGGAKADYPWVVAFGGNQLNMSTNQASSIFSNWNDTGDQGNMVEIRKVGDLSAEVLATANAAITEFEKDIIVGISSLDQLNPNKSYYVMNPRGDWAYDPAYAVDGKVLGESMLVATKVKGVNPELPAANKQFAFLQTNSGNRYLYNVASQKYVVVANYGGQLGTGLASAPKERLNFIHNPGYSKTHPWILALNEKHIGVSTGYTQAGGVITSWNSLNDEGNNVMVVEGDDFNPSALVAELNAQETALQEALNKALTEAKELQAAIAGGTLTTTDSLKTELNNAVQAAEAASIVKDDYNQLIEKLNAVITAIKTVPATQVTVSPAPEEGILDGVPAEIVLNFTNDIKSVDELTVIIGMGAVVPTDQIETVIEGKKITLKLPVDQIGHIPALMVMMVVTDVNGNHVSLGDDPDYITFQYNIKVPSNIYECAQITPAEGEVKSLKDFVLTFINKQAFFGDNIGGVDSTKVIVLRDDYGTVVANGKVSVDYDNFASDAKITLNSEVTLPGTYTLVVPEGTIYNSNYNGEEADLGVENFGAIYNPSLKYTYTIPAKVKVSPVPEEGILDGVPSEIILTFDDSIKTVDELNVVMGMGSVVPADMIEVVIEGKKVTLKLPVEEIGHVPALMVMMQVTDVNGNHVTLGDDPDYITFQYNIKLPSNIYECAQITPAEGEVKSLKEFVLTFVNKQAFFGDNIGGVDSTKMVVLRDDYGTVVANGKVSVDYDNFAADAQITLDSEVSLPGTYTLVVPEGTIYNSNYNGEEADLGVENFGAIYNPSLKYTYTIPAKVKVSPVPEEGILDEVPSEIILTFDDSIKTVDELNVIMGMGSVIPADMIEVVIEGKKVTLKLPVEELGHVPALMVMMQVTDVNGNHVTLGDDPDYITFQYNIKLPSNIFECAQITPAEGEVKSLNEFVLTFVNDQAWFGDNIGGVDSTKTVGLYDEYETLVATGKISVDYDAFSADAKITLNKAIVADGTYTLVVPEGTIYNSSYNGDDEDFGVENFGAIYNPELSFKYTVKSVPEVSVDPDPEAGALKEVPNQITFTFANEIKSVDEAMINLGSGWVIPLEASQWKLDGKVVTLNVPVEEITGMPGFVVILVVTDVNGNNVTFGPDEGVVVASYDIASPANTFLCEKTTPAEGEVTSLEQITLTFTGSEMVGGFDESKKIVLKDAEGNVVAEGTPELTWDSMLDVIVNLDKKIEKAGTYTLVVPEATVYDAMYNPMEDDFGVANLGAKYNPELQFKFTIVDLTGIESLFAGDAKVSVYNLKGELVAKSLKNLPKGIYIVNGKKVIVK